MFLQRLEAGIYGVNCYIVGDENTQKCIVIDPGGDFEKINEILLENEFQLKYVVLTHGHGDHIGATKRLLTEYDCKLVAHFLEKDILNDPKLNLSNQIGNEEIVLEADLYVHDNDKIELGDLNIQIIHTPGHTKGSITLIINDNLFTGDTLFSGSIGRTDLYSGDFSQMKKSLNKLKSLDDEFVVFPGHGPASRLGIEKVTNPYLVGED
ncbi:glyoxylase-like metal-dependent hydrolase (beta-lactamase superfamily II) [Acetoanaerobium pronyense]|uniref:Glyoxylase-like metal-dependent hydrolase (Beta-lactamase superfamily II) n=1 Tax=Acetoanaerobium pronyense TaxID=1482736 RepID=A0ABS4KIM0_9FIRM|nr:MBL fold metallo-hydrolase [Acetoanaerobium pronyense]MBP2027633.1 glyoxylase-like metal-dependent hydrolase (beta-lactamase superfamily II) [Acetoanaerobium pronyense]